MDDFWHNWRGTLLVSKKTVGPVTIWSRSNTYIPNLGRELLMQSQLSIKQFWTVIMNSQPCQLSLDQETILSNGRAVSVHIISSYTWQFMQVLQELSTVTIHSTGKKSSRSSPIVLVGTVINPGVGVEVVLVPQCQQTEEMGLTLLNPGQQPIMFALFITSRCATEAREIYKKQRDYELQNMQVTCKSKEEICKIPQTSDALDLYVEDKISNEIDSLTTTKANKIQKTHSLNSTNIPKVNGVADEKVENDENLTHPKRKENDKICKKSLIDTMKFKLCFESKDKEKPDMIKPSMLKRHSNKCKGHDSVSVGTSQTKFKENTSIDAQNLFESKNIKLTRTEKTNGKTGKDSRLSEVELVKQDQDVKENSLSKNELKEKINRSKSLPKNVQSSLESMTDVKNMLPNEKSSTKGRSLKDHLHAKFTSKDISKTEDISKNMDGSNYKSKCIIKNRPCSSNISSKVRSPCKDRHLSPDKSPSHDSNRSQNIPLSQSKPPIKDKSLSIDRYPSKRESMDRSSKEILMCKNSSPSKDNFPSTVKIPTKELSVTTDSSSSSSRSQIKDGLSSTHNSPSLEIISSSNNKLSWKEKTVNKATKINSIVVHNSLTKDKTCKIDSKHKVKVLKPKVSRDKICNLSTPSKKLYSRSRFYQFKSRFNKVSMCNRFKSRFNKGSISLKKIKLLRKLNLKSSLMKEHNKSVNDKTACTGHKENNIRALKPERSSKLKLLDIEFEFHSGPSSSSDNVSVNGKNGQIDETLKIVKESKSYNVVNDHIHEMSMKRKSDFSSESYSKKCKLEPEDMLADIFNTFSESKNAEIDRHVPDSLRSETGYDDKEIQDIQEFNIKNDNNDKESVLLLSKSCYEINGLEKMSKDENSDDGSLVKEHFMSSKSKLNEHHSPENQNTMDNIAIEKDNNNIIEQKLCTTQTILKEKMSAEKVNNNISILNVSSSDARLNKQLDLERSDLKEKVTPVNLIIKKTQLLNVDSEESSDSFKSEAFETDMSYLAESVEEEIDVNSSPNKIKKDLTRLVTSDSPNDSAQCVKKETHILISENSENISKSSKLIKSDKDFTSYRVSDTPEIVDLTNLLEIVDLPHIRGKMEEIEEILENKTLKMIDSGNLDDTSEMIGVPISENSQTECLNDKKDLKVIDKVLKKIKSSSVNILLDTKGDAHEPVKKLNFHNVQDTNEEVSGHKEIKSKDLEIVLNQRNRLKIGGESHLKRNTRKDKSHFDENLKEQKSKGIPKIKEEDIDQIKETFESKSELASTEKKNIDISKSIKSPVIESEIDKTSLTIFGANPEAELMELLSDWTTHKIDGLNFLTKFTKEMTSMKLFDIFPSKNLNISIESLISNHFLNFDISEIDAIIYNEILKIDPGSIQKYYERLSKSNINVKANSDLESMNIISEDTRNKAVLCRVCTNISKNVLTLPDDTRPNWFDDSYCLSKDNKCNLKLKKLIHIYNAKEEDEKKLKMLAARRGLKIGNLEKVCEEGGFVFLQQKEVNSFLEGGKSALLLPQDNITFCIFSSIKEIHEEKAITVLTPGCLLFIHHTALFDESLGSSLGTLIEKGFPKNYPLFIPIATLRDCLEVLEKIPVGKGKKRKILSKNMNLVTRCINTGIVTVLLGEGRWQSIGPCSSNLQYIDALKALHAHTGLQTRKAALLIGNMMSKPIIPGLVYGIRLPQVAFS